MHGRWGRECWSSEGVTETETCSKCRYRSCKGCTAVSNSRSSVMDNSGCWCGHCDPRRCKYRRRRCGYCETRSSECGSCVVNNCRRGSRHELLNMHGRWGSKRWSSEGVAEAETRSKGCYRSSKGSTAVSDSRSSVMDNSGCWCGHCDPRRCKYRRRRCGYCETRSSECGSCVVNNCRRGSRHELLNMHGRWGRECWSSEGVTETETCSKCRYRSCKGCTAVSNSRSSVMDNSGCWCGHCDPRRCKYRRRRCGYCETRSSECGSCVVNNCRRGSRHELLNMHGRWGSKRWSSEGVAEAETRSKGRYRSSKGSTAVSDSRSSVMDNSGCWCGHCDPRRCKYRRRRCGYCETRSSECGSCVVNNCRRGSRHELLNMHGRWGGECWSSEGVTETETCSKCRYRSCKGCAAVSNSRSSVMDNSGCWCGNCDPRCGK
ncbi:hypothetical protein MTO96_022653 [Rhipicephalus appendiculatus]